MSTTIEPVMYKTEEVDGYINSLADKIKASKGADSDLLLNYPAIYIHVWRSKHDIDNGTWSIYIGETNNILSRIKEHWAAARVTNNWQYHMLKDLDDKGKQVVPTVYFFGHKLFNKSLTLDIENKLIDFCFAMPTAHIYNGRGNLQGSYSGDDNLDAIFGKIWRMLRKDNPNLFLTEASIKKSAIYKASPNHKLTEDQNKAKQIIIDRTVDSILTRKSNQLIFVEGEAGTGKTVLTNSAFYEILENEFLKSQNLTCYMLINHEEQEMVYKNIARKLGYSEDIIQKPTAFLKKHSIMDPNTGKFIPDPSKIVDLVFVDEAHLLWNQQNRGYNNFGNICEKKGIPQLDEIMKRARVTVVMFDENQVIHKDQISTLDYIVEKRNLAKSQGPNPTGGENNYIQLINQLRMNCSKETMDWVDDFSKNLIVENLILDSECRDKNGYEVKIFDTPSALHDAIKIKAAKDETQLSRVIASYDWEYDNNKVAPLPQKYWQVDIDGWTLPWNEQLYHVDIKSKLNNRQKRRYYALDWAEKDYSINEVGSIFTIQGFDLAYAGVILGPSIRYDKATKKIYFDESLRAFKAMKGDRRLKGKLENITNIISTNELRVLMTRGTRGLYIYACDKDLRDELKNAIKY